MQSSVEWRGAEPRAPSLGPGNALRMLAGFAHEAYRNGETTMIKLA
jgi:hypothetical protein